MAELIHVDTAVDSILAYIGPPKKDGYSTYGYELWLPNIIVWYIKENEAIAEHDIFNSVRANELSSIFYDAAWELCRRGILRPSLAKKSGQATDSGGSGDGYSLTEFGRTWLADGGIPVPVAPGRMQEVFGKLADRLGAGFYQRAIEAAITYKLGANLACCAMCGAAVESILLAAAVAKTDNEDNVLELYRSAQGRRRLQDLIVGKAPRAIAGPFATASSLLSFWRDEASHGQHSTISEMEAHEALARLLRFAQFAADNWKEITQ